MVDTCPYLTARIASDVSVDCLQEECAWWDNLEYACAVRVMADSLKACADSLGGLAEAAQYAKVGGFDDEVIEKEWHGKLMRP